jgi:hypothetical protein
VSGVSEETERKLRERETGRGARRGSTYPIYPMIYFVVLSVFT